MPKVNIMDIHHSDLEEMVMKQQKQTQLKSKLPMYKSGGHTQTQTNTSEVLDTSAEIDCILEGNSSTPAATNKSNSFDSHTTQKAPGFNVTTILEEQSPVQQTKKPARVSLGKQFHPVEVESPKSPDSAYANTDGEYLDRNGRVYIRHFIQQHVSDNSSERTMASVNAQRSRKAYNQKLKGDLPKTHISDIREQVNTDNLQAKLRSRSRSLMNPQTPQTRNMGIALPVDDTDVGLFNTICELQEQFQRSEMRAAEMEAQLHTYKQMHEDQQAQLKSLQDVHSKALGSIQEEFKQATEAKDTQLQELAAQVEASKHSAELEVRFRTLKVDYEHYKDQCYKKDVTIAELEAQIKREGSLDEFEASLKEKEARLVKTELRLGQQALEQDHQRQKLESEKQVYRDLDEKERLRKRLSELDRDRERSRSRDTRYSRESRDLSRSRSRERYRRRRRDSLDTLERDYTCEDKAAAAKDNLRADALEKIIDFMIARQRDGTNRFHMDSCYNAGGPGAQYTGFSEAKVDKILKEFLSKDEPYLKDLLYTADPKKLNDYILGIYSVI